MVIGQFGIQEGPSTLSSDFEYFQRSDLTMPGWSLMHVTNDRAGGQSLLLVIVVSGGGNARLGASSGEQNLASFCAIIAVGWSN